MNKDTGINGVNVTELLEFKDRVVQDSTKADRNPTLIAHWVGGSRSRVGFKDKVVHIGGDDELNPKLKTIKAFFDVFGYVVLWRYP